ncbi:hypothetical protein MKW98_019917 [Papaver atlanticum]|uniref:histone acetyltransferase n=1 Tax=Papaver atlanticum TaxID=357466 RepID=A0AAD4S121_9MAGN|nr:hypothetical protein MKW98_019917 [Papaver atlanticum]
MDFQGTLMEVVYTGGIAEPGSTTTPPPPHQGRRSVAPAPNPAIGGNCSVMPPLDNTPQQFTSRWSEENPADIWLMRTFIRSCIESCIGFFLLSCNRNSNDWDVKFQNFTNNVEHMLFMEASTKAEYGDVKTLENRVISAVASIASQISSSSCLGKFSDHQVEKGRGMEIISNQSMMPPLNHHMRQQEYLLHQPQFPVQGKRNCDDFVNLQFQNYQGQHKQKHIQSSVLTKFNCDRGDAVSSRNYIDEFPEPSMDSTIDSFCYQQIPHQEPEHRIVHINFNTHQATTQHNDKKATAPFTFDAGKSAKPMEINYDISPAPDISFKKQKIGHTSNLPLSTDHQASGEMHPLHIMTPFSGYEITPEWGSLHLLESLQKYQQCMPYEPSVSEADMNKLVASALSTELVDSNIKEPILHPQNLSLAGEDDFWSKEIKEPDKHIETPTGQAEITEVDKIVGSDQSKIRGASLTETLTLDQLEEHVASLKQWVGASMPKVDEKPAMGDNACQLCAVEILFFARGSCFVCGKVFKKTDTYHSASKSGVGCRVCNNCFKKHEDRKLSGDVSGLHINKEKIRLDNDIDYQEPFVMCDICGGWQHHTCALFNNERNIDEKAEYICPKCYIQEINSGLRIPLDPSVIRGAADLRRTKLSNFIEDRLVSRLGMGKNSDEVRGDLSVRVVLSVEKKLLVKQEFFNVFKEENYPKELPYRSKVILLFQKIHGVDVCLFAMYVQEYGSKCPLPNQRSIYISYLDSVKYFRPDGTITAAGVSPRTFVYYQILLGYLDFSRRRGFAKCYIWSCPPSNAVDYIFNCHPEIQKSPKIKTLQDWYRKMLSEAASEKIVASVTNLYDHFFVPRGGDKVKAARLPYFDGDYWPLIAEAFIKKPVDVVKPTPVRKARKKKPSFEAAGCTNNASGNSRSEDQLMQDVGKEIRKSKENFIIVDLGTQYMAKDTDRDEDEVIEGKLFDGRVNFLDFCMRNNYQFDNLQRAKHSSMMILYYLHNPSAYVDNHRTCKNGINPDIACTTRSKPPREVTWGSKSRLFDHLKL